MIDVLGHFLLLVKTSEDLRVCVHLHGEINLIQIIKQCKVA